MQKITATRYHDISCGHRVAGHESKCAFIHGHNYRVHFTIEAPTVCLDAIGRVLDFSVIKSLLCEWLEANWDHRFLAWEKDELMRTLMYPARGRMADDAQIIAMRSMMDASVVWTPFNPTAENIALHLLNVVGPNQLPAHCRLISVTVDETRKCSASAGVDHE